MTILTRTMSRGPQTRSAKQPLFSSEVKRTSNRKQRKPQVIQVNIGDDSSVELLENLGLIHRYKRQLGLYPESATPRENECAHIIRKLGGS